MKVPPILIDTDIRTRHDDIIVPRSVLCQEENTIFRIFVGIYKKGGIKLGNLYNRIIALCSEKGIKGGRMCTDIGMSKGILTDLKMGRQSGISTANAQKIANYFGVTVGYLLGEDEKEKTATDNGNGLSESKQQLIALAEQCSEEEAEKLLQMMQILLGKQ
jgi:transcriptional regulator with XRE-family HTH domain